ncbi:TonB dependent receptor [Rhizorhabdus wittichii DC-6]|nr:TonB dependent receptor [Rhizorhabdus wittichii DC-6]
MKRSTRIQTIASLAALGWAGAAQAQSAAAQDPALDEIIVTAQKRSESVQDVPLAVSAVGGATLDRLGVGNPLQLGATVPNFNLQTNSGVTYIYLRGVGNNFLGLGIDSNVAYHANGVYIARPRAQVSSYFDVDRIEVVRGPQGDLYGRNATGGSINVITRKPTDAFSANATLSVGNYGLVQGEAGVGGAIVPGKVAVRAAGFFVDRGGYGKNEATGKDVDNRKEQAGRLTVELTPSEPLTIEIIADYFHANDAWGVVHQAGSGIPGALTLAESLGNFPSKIRNVVSGVDPNRKIRAWGVQGTATLDLADNMSLRSITAYRKSRFTALDELIGTDPSIGAISQLEKQHQFSEEVQFLANGTGWDFILGGYYFTESVDGFIHIPIFFDPAAQFDQRGTGDTKAYAVFAHGSWEFVPRLKLVLGARYSHEKRTSEGVFTAPFVPIPTGGEKSFNAFTPKATLQFEPSDNLTVYGGVSKGFKSGGFTIGVPGPGVEPEKLLSYEVGLKAQMFDRRLTANIAAFWYDYTNMVVTRVVQAQTVEENAGKSTIKGIEVELTARPTSRLRIDASLGLLDAKFDSFTTPDPLNPAAGPISLAGNRLPGSAKYTARVGAQYDIPVGDIAKVSISGDAFFSGDMYFDPYEHRGSYQPSYETYNASLTYDSGRWWSMTLWSRNLSNKTIVSNQLISADFWGYPRLTYLRDPRTYGIDFKAKF